jgi:hypothetical protein
MGGDDEFLLERRTFASDYMIYLLINGASLLAPQSVQLCDDPEDFAAVLMDADSWTIGDRSDNCAHKVIRWSFEQQNAYRVLVPMGAPIYRPPVDVYIDDGRGGEYDFAQLYSIFGGRTHIWNRRSADGGTSHQIPTMGVTNYAYVRVRNRGYQTANNVQVRGYSTNINSNLVFPDDWVPMTTPLLAAPGPIGPGAEVIVGPFEWTPTTDGEEYMCMIATADGDRSNTDQSDQMILAVQNGELSWPHWRLVPLDNNIAMRNSGIRRGICPPCTPFLLSILLIVVIIVTFIQSLFT